MTTPGIGCPFCGRTTFEVECSHHDDKRIVDLAVIETLQARVDALEKLYASLATRVGDDT